MGIREVIEKQDAHALNQVAFDLPSRLIAKIYLFRTIFRGSGWAFAHDPQFMHVSSDPKFWDRIGEKFYKKYNVVDKCHNDWASLITKGLPIVGPLGREWAISNRDKRGELFVPWTTLTNYPVQGTGADIMAIARVSFARRLKASGMPLLLVSTVHDSIIVDCPDEKYIQPCINLFHQVFDDIPSNIKRMFGYTWIVPMDCECKIGRNMLDMKKVLRKDK